MAQEINTQLIQSLQASVGNIDRLRSSLKKLGDEGHDIKGIEQTVLTDAHKYMGVNKYQRLKTTIQFAWKGALVLGVLACVSEVLPVVLTHVSMHWLPAITLLGMSAGAVSITVAAVLTFIGAVGLGLAINYAAERYKIWSQCRRDFDKIDKINSALFQCDCNSSRSHSNDGLGNSPEPEDNGQADSPNP